MKNSILVIIVFLSTFVCSATGFAQVLSTPPLTPANIGAQSNLKVFNVLDYGAKGNGQEVTDGSITIGTNLLTSPTGLFTPACVGLPIYISGANHPNYTGQALNCTISSYISATQVSVSTNAYATVSGATCLWGTNDRPAIQNAVNAAEAVHGTVVFPHCPATYGYVIAGTSAPGNLGNSSGAGIQISSGGCDLVGQDATLLLLGGHDFIQASSTYAPALFITQGSAANAIAPNDYTLTVGSGSTTSSLYIGETVIVELGNAPYDSPIYGEPLTDYFATVTAIPSSTQVTLDTPADITISSLSSYSATRPNNTAIYPIPNLVQNIKISGFNMINIESQISNAGAGIDIDRCKNVHIDNCQAFNPGPGLIVAQYVDNLQAENLQIPRCDQPVGDSSYGRCFGLAECHDVNITNVQASCFASGFSFVESGCTAIKFDNITINDNQYYSGIGTPRTSNSTVFGVEGGSSQEVDNCFITGQGCTLDQTASTNGCSLKYRNLSIHTSTYETILNPAEIEGTFDFQGTIYNTIKTAVVTVPFVINNQSFTVPSGIWRSVKAYTYIPGYTYGQTIPSSVLNGYFGDGSSDALVAMNQFGTDLISMETTTPQSLCPIGPGGSTLNGSTEPGLVASKTRAYLYGTAPLGTYITLYISYFLPSGTTMFQINSGSDDDNFGVSLDNTIPFQHIVSVGGNPTFSTSANCTAVAADSHGVSDAAGTVDCTTASTTTAGSVICTVHFAIAYAAAPKSVILTAYNSNAQSSGLYISSISTTGFTVSSVNAPTISSSLNFMYTVIQ